MLNIAVITPKYKNDYLTDTVIDGLILLKKENSRIDFYVPDTYPTDLDMSGISLNEKDFMDYADSSDLILFFRGKDIKKNYFFFERTVINTDYEKVNRINKFNKTLFFDGSEVGGNRRYDPEIQRQIMDGTYEGRGNIDTEMESKCALYFRREKPYLRGIIPFPFGIESSYTKYYSKNAEKDIDFFCVFGHEEYAPLRKEVKEVLIAYCKKNNFTCFTEKTDKDNFYKILVRSKVGISVGGGGYDTARFWETLGNNCILLTEKIDVYESNSERLKYKRIWQFKDLSEFNKKLEEIGHYIKNQYKQEEMTEEYERILADHSSKSRVIEIIEKAKKKGIIA